MASRYEPEHGTIGYRYGNTPYNLLPALGQPHHAGQPPVSGSKSLLAQQFRHKHGSKGNLVGDHFTTKTCNLNESQHPNQLKRRDQIKTAYTMTRGKSKQSTAAPPQPGLALTYTGPFNQTPHDPQMEQAVAVVAQNSMAQSSVQEQHVDVANMNPTARLQVTQ